MKLQDKIQLFLQEKINTDKNKKQESGSFTFTPNSSTELTAYYDEISAGESVDVKITFADKKVINMTDYKLTNLETGTKYN